MVPGTPRHKIAFLLALATAIIGAVFGMQVLAQPANQTYSASAEDVNLAVLDGIMRADKETQHSSSAKAVVVPHHLLASQSIALGVKALTPSSPRIIVILSPDHYARCPTMLCTTYGSYDTFFGEVEISETQVRTLERSHLVSRSTLFFDEHGIQAIVPFIKHYLPNAMVVPVVISQNTRGSEELRAEMLALLQPLLASDDVALVVSSDFSHYLPLEQTREADSETQASFCTGNSDEILNLNNPGQSDCPLCLWILEQTAKQSGFWNPTLLAHTNSAELLHDPSAPELTSHFTFSLSSEPVPVGSCPIPDNVPVGIPTLLFVGDMNFDRYIRRVARDHGGDFLFSCIDPLLRDTDLVVGNLEGPVTSHASVSEGTTAADAGHYSFTFPTTTAALLARHNIRLVNIGNNHIADFGSEGVVSTHKHLADAGVSYFGGIAGNTTSYQIRVGDKDLSFINYNQFGGSSPDQVAKEITDEHSAGRWVIVYTHWGEEYVEPTLHMRQTARLFAEHGADIIIGTHPHVVQSHEMIGDTPVYYSLGNFIFDQYWRPDVTEGLALLLRLRDKISIEETRVRLMPDGRTCISE